MLVPLLPLSSHSPPPLQARIPATSATSGGGPELVHPFFLPSPAGTWLTPQHVYVSIP